MRYLLKTTSLLVMFGVLSACASKPEDIQPAYVSTTGYSSLSCEQLGVEANEVSKRAAVAAGVQSKKAQQDAVATGVAIVVFWPAAFLIKGDGASSAEVARLKGEMQAIEDVSKAKKCGLKFSKSS